ncbi:unnamed protein product [Lactuca saligna]|uniref:Chromo domain-containing protein n=1 Tax=Lactuca saligna TaxID=75948 RepID=A0AA35YDT7_LACSI|nr:unnamed protein product [Lactuca saligna]
MKGGGRRRTITSDLRSPPSHSVHYETNDQENDQVQYDKQQQSMNDGDDGGNEYNEEEDEEYEDEDQSGDLDFTGGGADGGESKDDNERPKLAEGFYEIEAVRRKRIRKGETQYLIKWRGWPESSNTWEPVENLMSCSDFIDAFEESSKSKSNRRRKRKHSAGPTPQSKKKQKQPPHQRSPDATYEVPSVKIKIIEDPSPIPSVNNSNFSNDSGSLIPSPQTQEPKTKTNLDISLPELKLSSSTNQENMSDFAIHIHEDRADDGGKNGNKERKVDETEVVRVSPRIGAKRRKSGAVKRFMQDSKLVAHNVVEDEVKDVCALGDGLGANEIVGISGNLNVVTKILKPVNYSTSILNGIEDVSVSFLVTRSDGEEVVVDNKYLKEHNPLLLINYYEQHLRYNSPSE